jgi:hypothetical protein
MKFDSGEYFKIELIFSRSVSWTKIYDLILGFFSRIDIFYNKNPH